MHAMLAMYSSVAQDDGLSLLPFLQLTHNTAFSATVHEIPVLPDV